MIARPHRALVVFRDAAASRWLRLVLRPGFSHVSAVLDLGGDLWVSVDPLASGLPVTVFQGTQSALQQALPAGCTTVGVAVHRPRPLALPWAPYSCVEVVKRLLGLRAPWVLTPWQLYQTLEEGGDPP